MEDKRVGGPQKQTISLCRGKEPSITDRAGGRFFSFCWSVVTLWLRFKADFLMWKRVFGALNPTRSGLLHKISIFLLNFYLEMLKTREESDKARGGVVSRTTAPRRDMRNSELRLGPMSRRADPHSRSRAGAGTLRKKKEEKQRAQGNGQPGDQTARARGCPSARGAGSVSSPEMGLPTT